MARMAATLQTQLSLDFGAHFEPARRLYLDVVLRRHPASEAANYYQSLICVFYDSSIVIECKWTRHVLTNR